LTGSETVTLPLGVVEGVEVIWPALELPPAVTLYMIVAPSVESVKVIVKSIDVGPGLDWEYGGGGSGVADMPIDGAAGGGGAVCASRFEVEASISRPRRTADRVVRLKDLRVISFSEW
jgi:hypothetical protein